jgi:hypothetical protein
VEFNAGGYDEFGGGQPPIVLEWVEAKCTVQLEAIEWLPEVTANGIERSISYFWLAKLSLAWPTIGTRQVLTARWFERLIFPFLGFHFGGVAVALEHPVSWTKEVGVLVPL